MKVITDRQYQDVVGDSFFRSWDRGDWRPLSSRYRTNLDSGKLNALAKSIVGLPFDISGSILLIEDIGIFKSSENVFLATALRMMAGESRPIQEAPAHVFSFHDRCLLRSLIHVCMINCWDFSFISGDRLLCFHGSHDEYIDLLSLNYKLFECAETMMRSLELAKISVKAGD